MQSSRIVLPPAVLHQSFIKSPRFSAELSRVPPKWRKRLTARIVESMKWFSTQKIYEPIGWDVLNEYLREYVPQGVNLSLDDGDLCATAEQAAGDIATMLSFTVRTNLSPQGMMEIIRRVCKSYSVEPPARWPDLYRPADILTRLMDKGWWRRQLRKRHCRAFEAGSIRLGYVHYRAEPYASTDTVLRRMSQNRRNALALESVVMENENGDAFTLADLASKSTANKAIRRGELMLRINGLERVAFERGDEGLFLTLTCPSRFHAIHRHDGSVNDKYAGATPREAQDYLCKLWAQLRAALARAGIGMYGFRIAEPHHDGCPHWHMLLFVTRTSGKLAHITDLAKRAERIFKRYAWRADRGEAGAFRYRLDSQRIDRSKGTAAGYLIKYVSKNIDGEGVGDHKTQDGKVIAPEIAGDVEIKPCQRVEAWAACWGIRQFQPIGGAPVGVWRELRRIKPEMIQHASATMQRAWRAVQRDDATDQRADFAEYLRIQGGPIVPRAARVLTLAKRDSVVMGRYEEVERHTPYGVECIHDFGVVFKSQRYQWRQKIGGVGVVFDLPRTRVNNCTPPAKTNTNPDTATPATPGVQAPVRDKNFIMRKIEIDFNRIKLLKTCLSLANVLGANTRQILGNWLHAHG